MAKLSLFVLFVVLHVRVIAQNNAVNAYLNAGYLNPVDFAEISSPQPGFHSSFRNYSGMQLALLKDSLIPFRSVHAADAGFLISQKKQHRFNVLPLVDVEAGLDVLQKKFIPTAATGLQLRYEYGKNFASQLSYIGGIAAFPFFTDTALAGIKVLPEHGRLYSTNTTVLSAFSNLSGYMSWMSKNKVFNLQAGRGKFFIGDGYRSVLLSDFASPYPYVRAGATVWKLQYQVWYTVFNDTALATNKWYKYSKKYGAFHYLSYNVNKRISFGVFENVIWRGSDTNQTRGYELNYLNPLVFYRPQEYSLGSPDNAMLGANVAVNIARKIKVYGQLALDEFYLKEIRARAGWWANKQAWQVGAKWINAAGIKGLKLQLEYNEVRPFTYSHGIPSQNYAQYGWALAHPAGSNFREALLIGNYNKGRWQAGVNLWYLYQGKDTTNNSSNVGANIFRTYTQRAKEYGNAVGQGVLHKTLQSQLTLAYLLHEKAQVWLELGYVQRSVNSSLGYLLENPYIYLSLNSRVWNRYRDY
jgi:hypothetical protein